jgi:hypothetical protein
MSATWNDQFGTWAQAPSTTETDKIQHAISAVRKALDRDAKLSSLTKLFVQGSYRNRVNVRQDSDVDIGVLYTGNLFGPEYPLGKTARDFDVIDVPYGYSEFKNDLSAALIGYFGASSVHRGSKAFDLHANTYRVDADAVPLMIHRRYAVDGSFICGTELRPDDGGRIINWPERLYDDANWPNQHYENGNAKNTRTSRAYRGVVRILKKLRNRMDEHAIAAAAPIKGFLVECLAWNAPDSCFTHGTWHEDVVAILDYLTTHTSSMTLCGEWGEVSEYKYLFKGSEQKRIQAAAFIAEAREYIGI